MDISLDSEFQDPSSSSDENVNEQTSDGGVVFCYDETENSSLVHPTKDDVESIRKKLVEALKAEHRMTERQAELYEEQRDLKITIERAEADRRLLELQKTRELLTAQLEEVELQNV